MRLSNGWWNHRARIVRQPNGDAAAAYYVDGSSDPLYVRDARVERWSVELERVVDDDDILTEQSAFESAEGTPAPVAARIAHEYESWRAKQVSAVCAQVSTLLLGLDAVNRERALRKIYDLCVPGPVRDMYASSPSLSEV